MARAWSFLTIDEGRRQFTGNLGYDDVLERYYSFDSTVPNHGRVEAGDLAVLRDNAFILGYGWIDEVKVWSASKPQFRCPTCGKAGFKARRNVVPRYRCGHCRTDFDTPVERDVDVTVFRAVYERTWRPLDEALRAVDIADAYLSRAAQHAIRPLDIDSFRRGLRLTPLPAAPEWRVGRVDTTAIAGGFTRRSVPTRVGQQQFRQAMLERFGSHCAVLGPQPPAVLEAAHLYLFAEKPEHNVRGGLLLRRELHALFDRGLLVIDPDDWVVRLAPMLAQYSDLWALDGAPLRVAVELRPDPRFLRDHIAAVGFSTR